MPLLYRISSWRESPRPHTKKFSSLHPRIPPHSRASPDIPKPTAFNSPPQTCSVALNLQILHQSTRQSHIPIVPSLVKQIRNHLKGTVHSFLKEFLSLRSKGMIFIPGWRSTLNKAKSMTSKDSATSPLYQRVSFQSQLCLDCLSMKITN